MVSRLIKTTLATCLVIGASGVGYGHEWKPIAAFGLDFALPTTPPGMVPMIVYVPAPQMYSQPMAAPVAPHTHAPTPPQVAQQKSATHCSINDVAVLTRDVPSCEKAGGEVVAKRASFAFCWGSGEYAKHKRDC